MTTRTLKNYNDFCLFLTYIQEEENDDFEPALVIGGVRKRRSAFVIPLSAAYKYCHAANHPRCGYPTEYLVNTAKQISETIGLGGDRASTFRIASAIADHLEDLVTLKPRPDFKKDPIGEGKAYIGDQSFEFEI